MKLVSKWEAGFPQPLRKKSALAQHTYCWTNCCSLLVYSQLSKIRPHGINSPIAGVRPWSFGLSFPFICVLYTSLFLLLLLISSSPPHFHPNNKQGAKRTNSPCPPLLLSVLSLFALWNPFTALSSTWTGSRSDKNRFWPLEVEGAEPWLFRSITTSIIHQLFLSLFLPSQHCIRNKRSNEDHRSWLFLMHLLACARGCDSISTQLLLLAIVCTDLAL